MPDNVDKLFEIMQANGAANDRNKFRKVFLTPGNKGYKIRKDIYDGLRADGIIDSPTYEDFRRKLRLGGTPTVNKYRQQMFNSVDPNKSRASEFTHRAVSQAKRGMNNVRKPVVAKVVNREGKPTGKEFAITPAKTVEDLDREYAQETTKNWENELHDQMADADKDAAKISDMFKSFIGSTDEVGSVWGNMTRGGGIAGTPHSVTTNNGILENTEARQILAAGDYNRKRKELLRLEKDSRNGAIFDNHSFFRGMYDAAKDTGFLTGGASDIINAGSLLATKQDLDNGVHTKAGDMLMQQAVKNSNAQSQYGDNHGWMYTGGVITTNMAPFIVQIVSAGFSKGLSTSIGKVVQGAASKVALGTMKKAAGFASADLAKNIGKVTGLTTKAFGKAIQYGIVGAAQANTVGLGNVANDVINRYTGQVYQDEQGNYKFGTFDSDGNLVHEGGEDFLTALVKGEAAQTIEFATELAGGGIDAVGTALKNFVTKGGKKIINKYNMENVSKVIDFLLNNKVAKNARYLKAGADRTLGKVEVNSIVGESLEEELGIIANTVFTGDNKISDLWDEKQQSQIWGGMLLSIGLMKGVVAPFHAYNAKQYYSYKHKLNKADVNLSQLLGKEKWEELRNQIDATTNEDMPEMVNKINRDVALGKNRQPVREYIQNLLIMRGYDIGNMLAAKKAVEDKGEGVSVKNMEKNQAYQQGRDAYGYDTHEIQLDQEDKQKSLAQLLGISEQQLASMSDEELESFSGRDDNIDRAIYDYQLSSARYEGVVDNARDQIDLEVQRAAQAVDMYTDKSRNTIRNATIKASGGLEDYGVYIISGNIATHDDGSIDVSNSDDMILYYDPTTNTVEHADAMMFAELGSEENADEVRSQAMADAKEKAIKETTGIIDGVVEVGTQFKTVDADGTEHTYEVLADNGDGTAMITIDGNVPTELVKGENVQIPYSFEDLQKMKDEADQQRLQAAKAQREQMDKERAEQQMQSQTTQAENPAHEDNIQSAPIEDNIDYSDIIREDGKVQMVDVSDKYGNDLFPDAKDVFYIQGNKMRTKFAYIDVNGELKTQSFPTGLVKIKTRGEVSVDDYKKYRNTILAAESSFLPESSKIEDNSGENRGEIEEEAPTTEGEAAGPAEETTTSESGEDSATEQNPAAEQTPAITLEDGTIVPMLEDGNPDFSKLSAAQTAELYDTQFDEDADGIVSGYVSDAKKALDKANNMTVKGKTFVEQKAAKAAKEKAIADAQAAYDSAVAIRDAYNERQLAKEENTPEGRKSLIEKARRKYARLKNSEEWSERPGDLWNETVGKLLHRLYDATGIDVFNDTPNTVYEYVASNVGPYSLNYEGNDNSKGVQQETGLSRSDFAKLGWLAAEGKGMTIDAKVHRLWENRPSNLESADTQDIRNALISLITSGQTAFQARDYILNQRIELAESALEEQLRQEEDAAEAQKAKEEEEKKKAELEKKKAEEEKTNENRNAPELSHEQQKVMEDGEKLGFPAVDKEGEPINQNVIELANWAKEQGLEIDPTSKLNSYADLYVMCKDGFGVSTLVPDVGEDINQVFYFPDNVQGEQLLKLQEEFNVGRDLKHSADMNSEITEGAMFYDGDTAREFKEFVDKKVEEQNKVFGEQRPEEDLPFSAKENGKQQTTAERAADVEKNKADENINEKTKFPDKLKDGSETIEVPEDATDENPLGLQLSEDKVPFEIEGGKSGETYNINDDEDRQRLINDNKVDDKDILVIDMPKHVHKAIKELCKKMGLKVQFLYMGARSNGWIENGTMYLALDTEKATQFVFGHEMTHAIKQKNPEAYKELVKVAMAVTTRKKFEEDLAKVYQNYHGISGYNNVDDYVEEVVADNLGKFINDFDLAQKFSLRLNHPVLATILHAIQKIKSLLYGDFYKSVDALERIVEKAYVKTAKGQVTNSETGEDVSFSLRLKDAIEETETNPSDAQKESGNYKKGHIKFGGYDYTIENPKGSTRSGKDADGKEWKITMHDTYGYIRGKFGKDGDHLDMFINDKADLDNWNGDVFVVDQVNPDGSFDEHKVMYGYDSMDDAEKAYLANYSDGWQGLGNITGASKDEFDKWLDTSNRKLKPFADYAKVKFSQAQSVSEPRYSLKDIKPVGVGAFGNIYNQFRGNAKAAIEFLKKVRGGEAVGALHHKDIGDIDLVWGKEGTGHSDGYGLSKLVKYHPEVLDNLQEILNDMRVVSSSKNRVNLESETHKAGVRLTWDGERKSWLLTAFKKETSASDKRTDTAATSLEGDTALSQTEGSAAKIDNSSETAKENGEKFSLKEEKTLAGVHNITEEKLLKAIKQGGLANPSVAVIDSSKQNHENYGDISLILPSDKVAKRTGKNAGTWQGDAWTPTYPQVERQMSNKGAAKASKDVSSVPGDMYREVRRGLDRWLDGGEANSAMAYMFLHEKGVAPEPKKIQHKFSDDVYNELKSITAGDFNIYGIGKADAQKVLDMYIDAKFDGDKDLYEEKTKAWLERNKSIVDAGNKGGMRYTIAKENVELYDEYGFNYKSVQTFVRDVEYDHRKTGVDMNATLNEVEDYIKTNNQTDEFNTWLEGKEKEYGIKEVIFDGFTPSGNRRYVPNTLENVSKIMKKQGRNGATGISVSFQNFAASLMPSYGTLKDIRSKKGLLTSDYEDLDKFNEKWSKVFFELGMKCQPDATGTFDDYGLARLSEAAKTSDPQAYLKKEYNVDFSDEDMKRLKEMVKAIKEESPAMYFETKFERPVGFNEFSSAVVPTTASDEVKQALQKAGVQIYEYDKEKEGDRNRAFNEAINSSDNIRFSLKAMMEKPEGWKQANKKAIHIAEAIERDSKFTLKNLDGTLIKAGTYFSGGGLVEEGLKGIIDPVVAVEYDEKISGVYRNNFGQHIVTADVRDVDPKELVKQIDGEVEYFHASPVCKNYSQAKSNHAEVELDKETAASTAEFINAIKPKVVTIENVKGYKDSEAMKIITDALDANGYTWDADVYNAADYGGYTNRERLIVRAVRDGKLPAKPKKMAHKSGWYEAVADIIPTLTEKKNGVAPWMDIRLKADGIDWRNIDKPLYVKGSAYADGKIPHAFADELLPTLRTKSGDVIVMPDGKVYRAMGRVLARISGVSDDYKMPFSENLSHTIIGNGIPTQLTEHVIAPLLQNTLRPTTPEDGNTKFSLKQTNDKFNSDLKSYVEDGVIPENSRFELGFPSDTLLSAGFPKLPISMRVSLLNKKAGMERHPFSPTDLYNLVDAIQEPLAIFEYTKPNMRNLIVDLTKGEKHFLVGVTLDYRKGDLAVNSISGLFPKENHEWIKWIQDGKAIRIDKKDKVLSLIDSLRTNPEEAERIGLNLDFAAKIIKYFENPSVSSENTLSDTKFSLRGSTPYGKQMEEWKEKNHLEKDATPMKKPVMKEGENIFDYANRMVEWTRNQNLWKTAPKQTGFQEALDKWKADNGIAPGAYPPVHPIYEDFQDSDDYNQAVAEYRKEKEVWKTAPKPKDFDLSVDLDDMNKQLRNIRRAVLNQKNYDQRTVKAVSDLVRKMLNIGWGDGLSRGKVGNLLSAAKNATGANYVKKYLDKAMGILAENYLNRLSTAYDNLINTKGARADQSGVIKMGSLDAKGQAFMSEYKKAINMDDSSLNTYIANIEEDSAKNEDNVEMNDYRLAGIQAAIMYKQQIGGNDADIAELKRQIGELKNKKDATKEDKDLQKSLEKKLFENKFDRITMYENLLNNIQRMVKESKGRAKEFREKIVEHKNEILHRANLDLEGMDSAYYDTTTAKKKFVNNPILRFVMSSTYTFEQFLKFFGRHHANGEGYLYNYFMSEWQDAADEQQLYNEMNRNALDEKTKELFGKKNFTKLVGIDGKGMKEMDIDVTDYSNKKTGKRTIHLKQGQMLYIYLVNKETDGEMKLRAMGITEEKVAEIEKNLDPRVKSMGEWLQNEYLPECQRRYQATHTKYFGAPMKEVENYFPLAINNRARNVREDLNQDTDAISRLAGTSTGAIITRRVNVIPLDIENADAFAVAFNHLDEMEEWSAYLPFIQDVNTLLSSTHFRNQVMNMSSAAYGSGKTLWEEFKKVSQIAAGTYKPKVDNGMMDSKIAAVVGGIATAKISGRLWTAFKQTQSATTFLTECDPARFLWYGVNPYGSWHWAYDNLPLFRKRVEQLTAGDVKVKQFLDELEKYHDWTKTIAKVGMSPNILVDSVTCAVGARSVYETELNKLTKLGYPKDKAEDKAIQKASLSYNKTQQSSEGAFLSPMQVDRTYVSAALSLYKNANYAYGRKKIEAIRGIAKTYRFWGEHKNAMIGSMTRQIMDEDGLDENVANAIAKRAYTRTFWYNIGTLLNYMTIVPISWAAYKVLLYLLNGDDDDKKKKMIEEACLKGFATTTFDDYVIPFASNILNAGLNIEDGKIGFDTDVFKYQNLYINPATSDLSNIYSMIGNQKWWSAGNKFGMLGIQMLVGFNPETIGALYQAYDEFDNDSGNMPLEIKLAVLKSISAPEESIRGLYMDELGLDNEDRTKVPLSVLEQRYAERQINRDNLLSQVAMPKETFDGYVEKYKKSFEKKIQDKMDKMDAYDQRKFDAIFDTTTDQTLKGMMEKKRTKDANAAADEQIAKEGLNQEKKGKEPSEEAYEAVKMSIDVAEDNAISTYNKVLNKRYAALNDEYNEQTDAMKYIFMSKHPNFKAYKELESEYTNYGKKIKELKGKLVSTKGYDAKQTILKQIRAEREKFSELQSKVR